jgi:hypothetical protein
MKKANMALFKRKIRLWSLSSKSSTPAAECVIKNATKFVNTNDGLEIVVG